MYLFVKWLHRVTYYISEKSFALCLFVKLSVKHPHHSVTFTPVGIVQFVRPLSAKVERFVHCLPSSFNTISCKHLFTKLLRVSLSLSLSLQHEDFLLALQVNEDEYKKVRTTHTWKALMWPWQQLTLCVVIKMTHLYLDILFHSYSYFPQHYRIQQVVHVGKYHYIDESDTCLFVFLLSSCVFFFFFSFHLTNMRQIG